ncbi:hypothetical protein A2U01_0032015 [Trifolium medium]|uniref:Transmembrane protein n=1 Tax=Trifolium medium TaxID=97028 RepID=A0A392PFP4_9FABA|nr:hypothetical protein [Trifolium medium]
MSKGWSFGFLMLRIHKEIVSGYGGILHQIWKDGDVFCAGDWQWVFVHWCGGSAADLVGLGYFRGLAVRCCFGVFGASAVTYLFFYVLGSKGVVIPVRRGSLSWWFCGGSGWFGVFSSYLAA